ncbi:acyltransferase family protein [Cupriavidus sp. KB_39]|uniref:acyltransferase family protein n=1 Tax=Cupriavidus sp. KB_39 TaxID=3233036 RepID=UPI003F8FE8D8
MSSYFDVRLESLRGVAAAAVLFAHASAVFKIDGSAAFWAIPFFDQTPAQQALSIFSALFNPGAAVVLFFVLSGYVLTLSLSRERVSLGVAASYLVRRALRLLPPMWMSIVAMFVLLRLVAVPDGDFSAWYQAVFPRDLAFKDVVSNALLLDFRANAVTWTMFVEVVGSLFVLAASVLRIGRVADWIGVGALVGVTLLAYPSLALSYLLAFHLGGSLARLDLRIGSKLLCLVAIAVFAVERLFYSSQPTSAVLLAFASAALIVGVRNGAFEGLLTTPLLRFVGRISYSLYLLHLPVLFMASIVAVHIGVSGIPAFLVVLALSVPVALGVAWLGYVSVERWSIDAGRRLSGAINPRPRAILD